MTATSQHTAADQLQRNSRQVLQQSNSAALNSKISAVMRSARPQRAVTWGPPVVLTFGGRAPATERRKGIITTSRSAKSPYPRREITLSTIRVFPPMFQSGAKPPSSPCDSLDGCEQGKMRGSRGDLGSLSARRDPLKELNAACETMKTTEEEKNANEDDNNTDDDDDCNLEGLLPRASKRPVLDADLANFPGVDENARARSSALGTKVFHLGDTILGYEQSLKTLEEQAQKAEARAEQAREAARAASTAEEGARADAAAAEQAELAEWLRLTESELRVAKLAQDLAEARRVHASSTAAHVAARAAEQRARALAEAKASATAQAEAAAKKLAEEEAANREAVRVATERLDNIKALISIAAAAAAAASASKAAPGQSPASAEQLTALRPRDPRPPRPASASAPRPASAGGVPLLTNHTPAKLLGGLNTVVTSTTRCDNGTFSDADDKATGGEQIALLLGKRSLGNAQEGGEVLPSAPPAKRPHVVEGPARLLPAGARQRLYFYRREAQGHGSSSDVVTWKAGDAPLEGRDARLLRSQLKRDARGKICDFYLQGACRGGVLGRAPCPFPHVDGYLGCIRRGVCNSCMTLGHARSECKETICEYCGHRGHALGVCPHRPASMIALAAATAANTAANAGATSRGI